MYMNTAYISDLMINEQNNEKPLFISSCGNYRLINRSTFPTYRYSGRSDYQLLYIASGVAHFYFDPNGEDNIVSAGTFVLYRPNEYQRYIYHAFEHTEVFWIHFLGNDAENILKQYGITEDMHLIKTGTSILYTDIFKNIISEIKQQKAGYELMIEALFRQLLIHISRNRKQRILESNNYIQNIVDEAQQYFSEHYSEEININEYASGHGMSVSWFIRSFKAHTGSTPLQYILTQRIANAQILLESTEYPINEISSIVGYDNQLYFCRLFSKQKGISPSKYRELLK